MEFLNSKQKIIVGVVCAFLAIAISIYFIKKSDNKYSYLEIEEIENKEEKNTEKQEEEISTIVLHIAGEVNEEGVIEIENGARVIDAIEEAGGLTIDADISDINLAHELKDGEKIYIPKEGEEKEFTIQGEKRRK